MRKGRVLLLASSITIILLFALCLLLYVLPEIGVRIYGLECECFPAIGNTLEECQSALPPECHRTPPAWWPWGH